AAGLGKAGSEDHRTAGLPPRASRDGIDNHRFGHDEDHGIDALREIIDARHAWPTVDLLAAATDEVNLALVASEEEVFERVGADRAEIWRGSDDGHRAGPQQSSDGSCLFRFHGPAFLLSALGS